MSDVSDWKSESYRRAQEELDSRAKADRSNIRLWMTPERESFLRNQLAGYLVTGVSVDGLRCADFLDRLFGGLHHFPGHGEKIRKTRWDDRFVALLLSGGGELATYDSDGLTRAVLLGHAMAIRVSVAGRGMSRVEMHLHPRVRGGGELGIGRSHPGIDEMLASFRKWNRGVEMPAKCSEEREVNHG